MDVVPVNCKYSLMTSKNRLATPNNVFLQVKKGHVLDEKSMTYLVRSIRNEIRLISQIRPEVAISFVSCVQSQLLNQYMRQIDMIRLVPVLVGVPAPDPPALKASKAFFRINSNSVRPCKDSTLRLGGIIILVPGNRSTYNDFSRCNFLHIKSRTSEK